MKIKTNSLFVPTIFLLFIILMLSSCSHNYYAPNEGNVLKLSEAEDLKISVSGNKNGKIPFGGDIKHSNLQLGYSPIKHLGLFISHFELDEIDNRRVGNGHYTNLAVGTYYFKKKKKRPNKMIKDNRVIPGFLFDAYGGYGRGKVFNYYDEGGYSELYLRKYSLQGGLHWNGKIMEISAIYKLGILQYFKGSINLPISDRHLIQLLNIREDQIFPFSQVSLHGYLGLKNIRFYCDLSIVPSDFNDKFNYIDNLLSFGVVMELDEVIRTQKNQKK